MKKIILSLEIVLLLLCSITVFSQTNIKIAPKIISFKQTKVSLGFFGEGGAMLNASKTGDLDIFYKDPRDTGFTIPNYTYGIVLDLYSSNSIIGISSGIGISTSTFGIQNSSSAVDYFFISRVELPLYLKFRFGPSNGKKHFLFMLGGIYSIPQKCKRELFNNSTPELAKYTILEDDNVEQANSYFSLAGQFGYEFFVDGKKHFRVALYSKFVHPMDNELNANYPGFNSGGSSVLMESPNFIIKHNRIALGVKLKFQFGEAIKAMASSSQK
jgi:hypothetical protein